MLSMPERSSKTYPDRPADLDSLEAAIVEDATGEARASDESVPDKDPLAVELGRRGGLKGGKARAAKLSPQQRSEIARKAAAARWSDRSDERG
jgi:hypothetical protein